MLHWCVDILPVWMWRIKVYNLCSIRSMAFSCHSLAPRFHAQLPSIFTSKSKLLSDLQQMQSNCRNYSNCCFMKRDMLSQTIGISDQLRCLRSVSTTSPARGRHVIRELRYNCNNMYLYIYILRDIYIYIIYIYIYHGIKGVYVYNISVV